MANDNNVNVNETMKLKNNVNDNGRGQSLERSRQVDLIADRLAAKLGAKEDSRPFLCKVAWSLPEHRVWGNVEQALKGKNPMGLFIYLCKRDGI